MLVSAAIFSTDGCVCRNVFALRNQNSGIIADNPTLFEGVLSFFICHETTDHNTNLKCPPTILD